MESCLESVFIEMFIEGRFIAVIGCVYRPPNSNYSDFLLHMNNILLLCDPYKGNLLIAGDFNLNLLQFESDENINSFLNVILQFKLSFTVFAPTRITSHSATLIGNILTNFSLSLLSVNIILYDISDHLSEIVVILQDHAQLINSLFSALLLPCSLLHTHCNACY